MVFEWFRSEQGERRREVRLDRKHLETRSRRFLKNYLDADETRKPQFYQAVEEASEHCHPAEPPAELDDAQIAEATSDAAMKMVLERRMLKKKGPNGRFHYRCLRTVAVAYHRSRRLHHGQRNAEIRDGC